MWLSLSPVVDQVWSQFAEPDLQSPRVWKGGYSSDLNEMDQSDVISEDAKMTMALTSPFPLMPWSHVVLRKRRGGDILNCEVNFYHNKRKTQKWNSVQFKKNVVMFLASGLVIYQSTCYRSSLGGSSIQATIMKVGARHDFTIEGVTYKRNGQLRTSIPGSKARFLPPELFRKKWAGSGKWVKLLSS